MRLFVYGTLKRNCRNHKVIQGEFLGEIKTTPFYKMVDFGVFPGLVHVLKELGRSIVGELWEVSEFTLRNLDIFEGVSSGMFRREQVLLEEECGYVTQAYFATDKLISWRNPSDYPGDCWVDRRVSDLLKSQTDLPE